MGICRDPWIEPDPQPGDFDADLTEIDPRYVEAHVGDPNAKLTIIVLSVEGEGEERPQQLAARRVRKPSEVVADLHRDT